MTLRARTTNGREIELNQDVLNDLKMRRRSNPRINLTRFTRRLSANTLDDGT